MSFDPNNPSNMCDGRPRFTFEVGEVDRANRPYADQDNPDSFTVHLRIVSPVQLGDVAQRCQVMLERGTILGYCGGDSFFEWCEPFGHHEDDFTAGWAVHVHFACEQGPQAAGDRGVSIAVDLGIVGAVNATMSTGEDWAEQFECFEALGRIPSVVA